MENQYVLGVDVGGQTAKCGVVNAAGEVVAQSILVSNEHTDAEGFISALADTLKKLMKDAKAAGCKVVGGKGMLLWQGVEAFKMFTGEDMPVEKVRAAYFPETLAQ